MLETYSMFHPFHNNYEFQQYIKLIFRKRDNHHVCNSLTDNLYLHKGYFMLMF